MKVFDKSGDYSMLVHNKFMIMRFWQIANSNWTHLSAVMTEGMRNLEVHPLRNVYEAVSTILSDGGWL